MRGDRDFEDYDDLESDERSSVWEDYDDLEQEEWESQVAAADRKIEVGFIHNNDSGFDDDLFYVDRVYYYPPNAIYQEVVYAERVFKIKSPLWLQRLMFGRAPVIPF